MGTELVRLLSRYLNQETTKWTFRTSEANCWMLLPV